MSIELKMPALSPTMEEGKLARWLVKEGDEVASGDILAEIETDKATMEFEAVDEGTVGKIVVPEGTDGVKVGTVIALIDGEDDAPAAASAEAKPAAAPSPPAQAKAPPASAKPAPEPSPAPAAVKDDGKGEAPARSAARPAPAEAKSEKRAASNGADGRVIASPLARRLAAGKGVDLASLNGSGPHGRIIKADVDAAQGGAAKPAAPSRPPAPAAAAEPAKPAEKPAAAEAAMAEETRAQLDARVPHTVAKLSNMRKTIARRLAQSMQQAPHIYLTVDIRLDRLLAMRAEVNAAIEKQGVKLSVNDMLIKAFGRALIDVPECNVSFAGAELIRYSRADISVAVSIPGGLITPIVQDANGRSLSSIAKAMKDFGARAKEGKLAMEEYQGGTASLSNMGMLGIKQFTAVINPPQATILGIGAGEQRPWVTEDGALGVATAMSATGSFDHRAIDGADGARLMGAFKEYVENPLGMLA